MEESHPTTQWRAQDLNLELHVSKLTPVEVSEQIHQLVNWKLEVTEESHLFILFFTKGWKDVLIMDTLSWA